MFMNKHIYLITGFLHGIGILRTELYGRFDSDGALRNLLIFESLMEEFSKSRIKSLRTLRRI